MSNVDKKCRKCKKLLSVDPEAKYCVCYNCGVQLGISRALSGGKHRHGISLWIIKR
jgi:hypothetical protein